MPRGPRVGPEGGELDSDVATRIHAQRGSGAALDHATRAKMDATFGHNFADVRVHSDGESDALNRGMGANAFTVGSDIFLKHDALSAGPYGGDRLLTHELTHVVQQRGAQRNGPLTVTAVDGLLEREASTMAGAISAGNSPGVLPTTPSASAGVARILVQRDEDKGNPAGQQGSSRGKRGGKDATPKPTPESLARDVDILKKRQQAQELDMAWQAKFAEKMGKYRQTILRVTGGIEAANKGFQDAQVAQSQTDAMWTQFIGLAASVAFAGGFQFLAVKGLGSLGVAAAKLERDVATKYAEEFVEHLENPANALFGGYAGSMRPTMKQGERAEEAQQAERAQAAHVPGDIGGGGSAVAFFASQSEELERHATNIAGMFAIFYQDMRRLSPEAATSYWLALNLEARERFYEEQYKELETAGRDIEGMRPAAEVALVIERHLWAAWIKGQHDLLLQAAAKIRDTTPQEEQAENPYALANFGSDINEHLIKLGIEKAAKTGLYTHWWQRNADDWEKDIMNWAQNYKESIAIG